MNDNYQMKFFPAIAADEDTKGLSFVKLDETLSSMKNWIDMSSHLSFEFSNTMDKKNIRNIIGADLFSTICSRAHTISRLLPTAEQASSEDYIWDCGSILTLARSIVEARIAFHYFFVDDCPEEWDCRSAILSLHSAISFRKSCKLLSPVGCNQDKELSDMIDNLDLKILKLTSSIEGMECFKNAHNKSQILQGRTALMYTIEKLAEPAGIPRQKYKMIQNEWCLHVHANPVSTTLGQNIGTGALTDKELSFMEQAAEWAHFSISETGKEIMLAIMKNKNRHDNFGFDPCKMTIIRPKNIEEFFACGS